MIRIYFKLGFIILTPNPSTTHLSRWGSIRIRERSYSSTDCHFLVLRLVWSPDCRDLMIIEWSDLAWQARGLLCNFLLRGRREQSWVTIVIPGSLSPGDTQSIERNTIMRGTDWIWPRPKTAQWLGSPASRRIKSFCLHSFHSNADTWHHMFSLQKI